MKSNHIVLGVLVSLAACASDSQARDAQAKPLPQAQPQPQFEFPAGDVPITDLVARCGAFLGWNILFNPQELQGVAQPATIALERPVQTDRDGCEDLLSSLLWSKGFGIMPLDGERGVYEVVFMAGSRAREYSSRAVHRTVEQVRARPNSYFCVTVAAPLQHTNDIIATNALRPFFASMGRVGSSLTLGNVGNGSAIVINGPQHSVVAALDMLRTVDVPMGNAAAPGSSERLGTLERAVEQLTKRVDALEKKQ